MPSRPGELKGETGRTSHVSVELLRLVWWILVVHLDVMIVLPCCSSRGLGPGAETD